MTMGINSPVPNNDKQYIQQLAVLEVAFQINISVMYNNRNELKLVEAEWRIYASAEHTNIASDNGLSPVRRQAVIWTSAATLSTRSHLTWFSEIVCKLKIIVQGNAFALSSAKVAAILSRPQSVKALAFNMTWDVFRSPPMFDLRNVVQYAPKQLPTFIWLIVEWTRYFIET